jgi:hypothetical protein
MDTDGIYSLNAGKIKVSVAGTYLISIQGITGDMNYDARITIQANGVDVGHIGMKNNGGAWHGYSATVVATLAANQEFKIKGEVGILKLFGGRHMAVSIVKLDN